VEGIEAPTGKDEKEKYANFVAKQEAKIVVKATFNYKLKKDETFRAEIEAKMEKEVNAEGRKLDESVYPKKDGKYTREAMVRYLFEKETGQTLQFTTKTQETGNNNSTDDKHWDKYKH